MPEQLEERLTLLEAEVDRLKRKIEPNPAALPWWEKIAGNQKLIDRVIQEVPGLKIEDWTL